MLKKVINAFSLPESELINFNLKNVSIKTVSAKDIDLAQDRKSDQVSIQTKDNPQLGAKSSTI